MRLKTVLWFSFVVYCVFAEEIYENNDIDSDFLMQDLAERTKKSPVIFDTVDKKIAARASESESDIKYILAEDIRERLEALKQLNEAFETVKTGIDSNKTEVKDLDDKAVLPESANTLQSNISLSNSEEAEDDFSRATRQYYPVSSSYITERFDQDRKFTTIGEFGRSKPYVYQEKLTPFVYSDKNDPYIAQYNPKARTFASTDIQGGFQANTRTDTEDSNKKETTEEGVEKGALDEAVIRQGGIQGGFFKGKHIHPGKGIGLGGGLGGGGLGGGGLGGGGLGGGGLGGGGLGGGIPVHPFKQIKYLLPSFLSAITTALGGATAAVGGGGLGGGGIGGLGGLGGGLGGLGGGLGGGKHKHKALIRPSLTVNKVIPQPIKIKPVISAPVPHAPVIHAPVTHTPQTHLVPIKKVPKKGGFFFSKKIIFGKIDDEPHYSEGHFSGHPSYFVYPQGGHQQYSGHYYLSPFASQYADRNPYYSPAYFPDAPISFDARFPAYPQGNLYSDPSYYLYPQGQYYYPVDVNSLNDGGLGQFQFIQDPTVLSNTNNDNIGTSVNREVRSSTSISEQYSPAEISVGTVKADIEEEQKRIRELQDTLKS